jgi:5-methylcytosine-specific restriction endonuclease McrA
MARSQLMARVAQSDSTFRQVDGEWIGKCLLCNAPLRFDAGTGGGATVEHIIPRMLGGTDELLNLGLAHARCNYEKGVQWDEPKQRRGRQKEYESLITSLLTRRRARWRDPGSAGTV